MIKKEDTILNESFLTKHADEVDWDYVIRRMDVEEFSRVFFRRFSEKINWFDFSKFQLPESFLRENLEFLNMHTLCVFQKLSESFMSDNEDIIDWTESCKNQEMSEEFIHKHREKVNWISLVFHGTPMSKKFTDDHQEYLNLVFTK